MAYQINKKLRRIAEILIFAGMITALISPAACDEFYNSLIKLNGQPFEISYYSIGITHDCITSCESASHNQYRSKVRRSGNTRADIFRLISGGSLFSSYSILVNHFSVLLLILVTCVAALSYYHIKFIHLKDGHK